MMERRTIIALAISFALIGLYPLVLEKVIPGSTARREAKQNPVAAPAQARVQAMEAQTGSLEESAGSFAAARDVTLDNGSVRLGFNPVDGAIRQIEFLKFSDPKTKEPLRLFSLSGAGAAPLTLRVDGAGLQTASEYRIEAGPSSVDARAAAGMLEIEKSLALEGAYHGTLRLRFKNASQSPLSFQYRLLAGESFPARNSIDTQYSEANFYEKKGDSKVLRHLKEAKAGKVTPSQGPVEWVAVKDRQFSIIVKPKAPVDFTGVLTGLGHHRFTAALLSPAVTIGPGQTIEQEFLVYVGPNDMNVLLPIGLESIINFGKLDGIAKLLVGGLELIHGLTRNWGLAIIALTALINLLLFPLTRQSYLSMKRMQLIQPQMNKLKEQHKKNPERMNKEMMELYKKHKVNPFGGCLPMIAQMPVFIALYVALSKSTVLMNANFLWINDLSSPDRVALPFALPLIGSELHLLPLIMCAGMVFQQKLTQVPVEGQDPAMAAQQRMMQVTMPIIFLFIFYSMPSGLVLYWLTNTLLMTLYQLRLKKVTLTA